MSQPSFPVVKSGPVPPSPTPPSPTPPSPTPPSPSPSSHYEKPPCQSDETEASIQGMDGSLCAPKCAQTQCPKDKPPRTLAFASCMLQDQSGDKYCALACFADFMCPKDSKCGKVGGLTALRVGVLPPEVAGMPQGASHPGEERPLGVHPRLRL